MKFKYASTHTKNLLCNLLIDKTTIFSCKKISIKMSDLPGTSGGAAVPSGLIGAEKYCKLVQNKSIFAFGVSALPNHYDMELLSTNAY